MKSKEFLKQLNTIYFTQVGFIIACVIYSLYQVIFVGAKSNQTSILYTSVFLVIVGIFVGRLVYKRQCKKLRSKSKLKDKLHEYQKPMLLRAAALEIPALFSILGFYRSGNIVFLLFVAAILIMFALFRPSVDLLKTDLELTDDDINKLTDPDGIID